MNEERIKRLERIAVGQALSGSVFVLPWIAELVENEQLMIQARAITNRSEDDIRVALARSPLSFADFVRGLAAGRIAIDDSNQ